MSLERFPPSASNELSALGFDYGTQRIGVAYGQTVSGSARPVAVLKARDGIPDWDEVASLLAQWQPQVCVVGMPYMLDGSDSELLKRAEKFARRLHGRFGLPIYGMDERLSSHAARESRLALKSRPRSEVIDDVAAQIILEDWLRELARQRSTGDESA